MKANSFIERFQQLERRLKTLERMSAIPSGTGVHDHDDDYAPLSSPRGVLAIATRTTNQTGIESETDITGLSVTVAIPANRRIRVHSFLRFSRDSSLAIGHLRVYRASTQIAASSGAHDSGVSGSWTGLHAVAFQSGLSAGSYTFKASLQRSGGATGTISMQAASTHPAFIVVEDVGPI